MAAGQVAFECDGAYLMAMDNGCFTLGAGFNRESAGRPPNPEEVLTLVRTPDSSWFALKTGYGKYVAVTSDGKMSAVSEAIGAREKWELVFQDNTTALHALANNCFVSWDTDKEGYVYAANKTAVRPTEHLTLRTIEKPVQVEDYTPAEDKKSVEVCESSYSKMFSHSKVPLYKGSFSNVRQAKQSGELHEALLDSPRLENVDCYNSDGSELSELSHRQNLCLPRPIEEVDGSMDIARRDEGRVLYDNSVRDHFWRENLEIQNF